MSWWNRFLEWKIRLPPCPWNSYASTGLLNSYCSIEWSQNSSNSSCEIFRSNTGNSWWACLQNLTVHSLLNSCRCSLLGHIRLKNPPTSNHFFVCSIVFIAALRRGLTSFCWQERCLSFVLSEILKFWQWYKSIYPQCHTPCLSPGSSTRSSSCCITPQLSDLRVSPLSVSRWSDSDLD